MYPEIRLLGPLELLWRGQSVHMPAGNLRILLAKLAVQVGGTVQVEQLIDTVWEHDPPASARTTLRGYVKRLRKIMPAELIRSAGGGYQLCLPAEQVDLHQFRRLVGQARASESLAGQAELLHQAMGLWRGNALDDPESAALRAEIGLSLREERLNALQQRIEVDRRLGAHAELVPELTALVAHHPMRETFWYELILALHRAGRQAEALTRYEQLREVLADSIGVDPAPQLRELHRRILVGDIMVPARQAVPA